VPRKILELSKIETSKLELEQIGLDLRETLEGVTRLIAILAHAKGLEVTANIDPAVPDLVKGDRARVQQILLNLCGNAVKFTQQGKVALSVRLIEADPENARILFKVCDTGVGIPANRLDALFTPFSQLDTPTTRRFGGTGLGLSIVKRLVELMGGTRGPPRPADRGAQQDCARPMTG
jgi:signal transduction histidine kinase